MTSTLSFIHPQAQIADNVTIEAFCSIAADVVIGEGTWIGPNSTIMDGARIGKNCRIFPGAVISAEPQDLKYKGERSTATIGDDTIIRECVTINKGTRLDRNDTKIGRNCVLMAYTHVAHDCRIGNRVILANLATLGGHVGIDDGARIAGIAAVHQFVRVGRLAMMAGLSAISQDLPPFCTTRFTTTNTVAGINSVGLRRAGIDADGRQAIKAAVADAVPDAVPGNVVITHICAGACVPAASGRRRPRRSCRLPS